MEALNMYLITACFRFWSFWKREPGLKCTLQYWLKIRFCWIMNQKCKIEGVLPLSPLGWIISDIQCSALSNVSFISIRILIMNYWACKLIYVSIIFIAFCVELSDNKPTKYLISIETGSLPPSSSSPISLISSASTHKMQILTHFDQPYKKICFKINFDFRIHSYHFIYRFSQIVTK